MIKIMSVFGTRPEAIKMCPLVKVLENSEEIDSVVCVTGQHKEMLTSVLDFFEVVPDYNLTIMKEKQDLFDVTSNILNSIKEVLLKEDPDMVLVHGDTSTTFATALACFYLDIPVGHVEAGLRTYNMKSPFPEEFNRCAVSLIADLHFAPTSLAKERLLKEDVRAENIYITGNTAIDALSMTVDSNFTDDNLKWASDSKLVLVTAHRRENIGDPMENMFSAISRITEENEDVKVIYPIHMNPRVREIANKYLSKQDRIKIIEPLDVVDFHNYINASYFVLTDSGGIQEEAPSLGKPVLVMRDTTERPEGIDAGTIKLVGTEEENIYYWFDKLINDDIAYRSMEIASNPYGDGTASIKIKDAIIDYFKWKLNVESGESK